MMMSEEIRAALRVAIEKDLMTPALGTDLGVYENETVTRGELALVIKRTIAHITSGAASRIGD